MISDPMGWDILQEDSVVMAGSTNDKHFIDLRKKLKSAQDETLR